MTMAMCDECVMCLCVMLLMLCVVVVVSYCVCARFAVALITTLCVRDELMLSCLMVCSVCTKKKTEQDNDVSATHPINSIA